MNIYMYIRVVYAGSEGTGWWSNRRLCRQQPSGTHIYTYMRILKIINEYIYVHSCCVCR